MSDVEPGRPLLVFLNEVAGGRKLLQAVRERQATVSDVVVAAPQNQPSVGQLIDADELREAARARVEVTMAVLAEFGIDSVGEVMDPEPWLASAMPSAPTNPARCCFPASPTRASGLTRKDLVEWIREKVEPETKFTHIPVRIEDDAIRWDLIHTLVVATKTVAAPDLVSRLKERASNSTARTATRSSARAARTSARGRSSPTSPRPWPSSTAPTSTPPASR